MSRILRAPVLLLALILALALPALPPPAAAARTTATPAGIDKPDAEPDTALGALAAVGCGWMVRATIVTGGSQVATIAGAIACCGFVLFDVVFLEK